MGINENGRPSTIPEAQGLNVFALVIYIPGPLGCFLDDLRRELVPHYNPHAHVSVLPPRPLGVPWQAASDEARALIEGWAPFDVELSALQVFPVTDVIYLEVDAGASDLRRMHAAMNAGSLAFQEPFSYHPHITLAQEVPHEGLRAMHDLAHRRWAEYEGSRSFRAERAVFVQNTMTDCWVDLAEYTLGAVSVE
ncbi:MAG TPA: 2'-5' RNA ligase family protein [Bryobacteraceae bacterium]|jgi:2'-5' RNA ligase|nr:2'-5' RNA ligase family protein [Bryobacteraceae bacterium]